MKKLVSVCLVVVTVLAVASCAAVKPAPKGADLVITNIKVVADAAILEGSPFAFEFTVKNIGTDPVPEAAEANPFFVPRVAVYQDEVILAVSQAIPALKAGAEATLQTEIFKDGAFPPVVGKVSIPKAGEYTLHAILDPSGYLEEVTKDNNTKQVKLKVEPKPKEEKK